MEKVNDQEANLCSICQEKLSNPVLPENCHHLFCFGNHCLICFLVFLNRYHRGLTNSLFFIIVCLEKWNAIQPGVIDLSLLGSWDNGQFIVDVNDASIQPKTTCPLCREEIGGVDKWTTAEVGVLRMKNELSALERRLKISNHFQFRRLLRLKRELEQATNQVEKLEAEALHQGLKLKAAQRKIQELKLEKRMAIGERSRERSKRRRVTRSNDNETMVGESKEQPPVITLD